MILHTFDKFPLSICALDMPLDSSEILIESHIVEDITGLIKFLPVIDPKKIYLNQHNSSIGNIWKLHNEEFSKFILKYSPDDIIDIGGGTGNIFKSYVNHNKNINWTIIDINPSIEDTRINIIKDLFDIKYIKEGATIITSHFIEHLVDLENFLLELRSKNPKSHIFSLPNFKMYMKNNYAATLSFEHPYYLTEEYLTYILRKTGWKVIDKQYYDNHSIFFNTEPSDTYIENINISQKEDIFNFIDYMKRRIGSISSIDSFYVFGAHYIYYYLLNFGIKEEQIIAVIDNDPNKHGKRMYGTNTKIISPVDVPINSKVFLEMGPYNNEIKHELSNIIWI